MLVMLVVLGLKILVLIVILNWRKVLSLKKHIELYQK